MTKTIETLAVHTIIPTFISMCFKLVSILSHDHEHLLSTVTTLCQQICSLLFRSSATFLLLLLLSRYKPRHDQW